MFRSSIPGDGKDRAPYQTHRTCCDCGMTPFPTQLIPPHLIPPCQRTEGTSHEDLEEIANHNGPHFLRRIHPASRRASFSKRRSSDQLRTGCCDERWWHAPGQSHEHVRNGRRRQHRSHPTAGSHGCRSHDGRQRRIRVLIASRRCLPSRYGWIGHLVPTVGSPNRAASCDQVGAARRQL